MIKSSSTYPQISDWSTEQTNVSQYQYTFDQDSKTNSGSRGMQWFDHITDDDDSNNFQKQKCRSLMKYLRCCSCIPTYLKGLLLGLLVGGLALCVIIPLWLTSNNITTSGFMKISTESSITSSITSVSSTSSTSTTSVTSTTTTTQNPQLATFNGSFTPNDIWTPCTYSYLAATSENLVLQFYFQTNNKFNWYLDDVSVRDSSFTEKLTNGNFESTPALTGWVTNSSGSCTSTFGVSNTRSHSSSQSFYDSCIGGTILIRQSFAAIGGQVYNITFWFYLDRIGAGSGSGTNELYVRVN